MSFNMNKLVCSECGDDKVQSRAWVNSNTLKFIEFVSTDEDDNWCSGCMKHVDLITQDEFFTGEMREITKEESQIIERTFNRSIKDEPTKF